MQLDTDMTGLIGITLMLVSLLAQMPRIRVLPLQKRTGLLVAATAILSIPVFGLSLAGVVRGITGDLSIATLILLVLALVRSFLDVPLVGENNRNRMLLAILVIALLFYPLALGLGMSDPYRLGYGNVWFLIVLFGGAVWASLRFSTLLALCISFAVMAWSAGWYESPNLWDYLLDPWLSVYAFAALLKQRVAGWKKGAHA